MYQSYSNFPADTRPPRDVEFQLRELTQDFATAFNTGNYDHAASMFSFDGTLMAPHYDSALGQKPVEHLLRHLGELGYNDLRMETTRIEHSGDMAMELGRFSMMLCKPDGTKIPDRGKYVRVWRRLGAWLLVADCWSRTAHTVGDRAA